MNQLRSARLNLSIVLPCYNPKPGWHLELYQHYQEIRTSLPPDLKIELIVVNDGSPLEPTAAAKRYLAKRCPYFRFISYNNNMGKGYAVRKGVEAARSPYIIYTDIDFPYTVADLCRVYQTLVNDSADVVMGVREARYGLQLSWLRRAASNTCNFLNKTLLNLPHKDVQSGLKGMNSMGRELLLQTTINRFLFDTEFIWMARTYSNVRIKAIPVTLRDAVVFTSMSSAVYMKEAGNFCRILAKDTLLSLRNLDAEFAPPLQRSAQLRPGRV